MNKAPSSLITNRSSLNDTATESSTAERALRPGKGQRLARRGLCLGIDDPLPAYTRDEGVLAERFAGCLLGGAVGDALGRPLEGGSPGSSPRIEWVEDYRQWHGWRSGPKGTITDDTQFSMWLLQSLIARGCRASRSGATVFG
jgi:hypothetical protein